MKVKILKSGKYSLDGMSVVEFAKDEIVDIPEIAAKDFVRGGLVVFIQDNIANTIIIETPQQPNFETQVLVFENMEYKDLLELAKASGFENGKGKPSEKTLIKFLRGQDE